MHSLDLSLMRKPDPCLCSHDSRPKASVTTIPPLEREGHPMHSSDLTLPRKPEPCLCSRDSRLTGIGAFNSTPGSGKETRCIHWIFPSCISESRVSAAVKDTKLLFRYIMSHAWKSYGDCTCFVINICVYLIWSGDDLHCLMVNNFKELASSLEGCVNDYLRIINYERTSCKFMAPASGDQLYLGYNLVLESAGRAQTLLGFAIWEPTYGRYRKLHYPWSSYVNVSNKVRHCAYTVMALHGCIMFEIQAPPEKAPAGKCRGKCRGCKSSTRNRVQNREDESLGAIKNILEQVHEAAEQLQSKIDQRSFLLVNSESWEIGSHKDVQDLNEVRSEKEDQALRLGTKSLSETAIYIQSP